MTTTWEEVLANRQRYETRRALFLKHGYDLEEERAFIIGKARPVEGRILEVGTGKGHLTVALAREGGSFISVDLSAADQEIALLNLRFQKVEDRVRLEVADAESLPFPDGAFDLIVSANVLHHLARPRRVFEEVVRVLAPAGRLVVSDFNDHGLEVIDRIHQGEGGRHEVGQGSLHDLRSFLAEQGFSVDMHPFTMQDTLVAQRQTP